MRLPPVCSSAAVSHWSHPKEELQLSENENILNVHAASDPLSEWPNIDWGEQPHPGTPGHKDFAEESSFSSPRTEPLCFKASIPADLVTPEKLRTAVDLFRRNGPIFSPLNREKIQIDAGLKELPSVITPIRKRKAEQFLMPVYDDLAPNEQLNTVEFHERAEQTLKDGISNTAKKVIRTSLRMGEQNPLRIVPFDHLTKRRKKSGFHLDLGNTDHTLTNLAHNPHTKIRYVSVDGLKNSSLFPPGTTREQLIEIIAKSPVIAERANRCLKQTSDGYVIECYLNAEAGGLAYSSVFPLFYFAPFSPATSYQLLENFAIGPDEAIKAAMSDAATIEYCTYDEQGKLTVFVDIAPVYKAQTGVDRGIILQFNSDSASDLITHYENYRFEEIY